MLKVGILGGGQLGRMLLQAAANYQVKTFVLENDERCPSAHLCDTFIKGNIKNYDDVLNFGKELDAITIEIENVNIEALEALENSGVKVYPKVSVLRTIRNKRLQKQFYRDHQIPTSEFLDLEQGTSLPTDPSFFPGIFKWAEGGYDGKGVEVIEKNIEEKTNRPAGVLEKKIRIKKEIAVIVAVDQQLKTTLYPPVEMVFNKDLNLLDYQLSPADITKDVLWKTEAIALSLVRHFESPGLFAVELFIDHNDDVLVNETAPRVHNSGHHTIEAHFSSQFDMLWRIILGHPLGNTKAIMHSAMVNILGTEGIGNPHYQGLNEVLRMDNAFVHLYGKHETRPGRKMGHVTVMSNEKQELTHKANRIRQALSVTAHDHQVVHAEVN